MIDRWRPSRDRREPKLLNRRRQGMAGSISLNTMEERNKVQGWGCQTTGLGMEGLLA